MDCALRITNGPPVLLYVGVKVRGGERGLEDNWISKHGIFWISKYRKCLFCFLYELKYFSLTQLKKQGVRKRRRRAWKWRQRWRNAGGDTSLYYDNHERERKNGWQMQRNKIGKSKEKKHDGTRSGIFGKICVLLQNDAHCVNSFVLFRKRGSPTIVTPTAHSSPTSKKKEPKKGIPTSSTRSCCFLSLPVPTACGNDCWHNVRNCKKERVWFSLLDSPRIQT